MKYENSIIKDYILRSFASCIRGSSYLESGIPSCQKVSIWVNSAENRVYVEAFCREKLYDDESKWVKHYTRKFTAGEILRIMETENLYESGSKKSPDQYAYDIWREISASEDAYYKDKE